MGKEPAAWLLGTVTQGIKDLSLLESWSLRSVSFEQPFNKLPSLALEDLFFLLSGFFVTVIMIIPGSSKAHSFLGV